MKTLQIHFGKALICALMISSISCSTDEVETSENENLSLELKDEINESTLEDPNPVDQINGRSSPSPSFTLRPFRRYYAGGSLTVHTYNYQNIGAAIGSFEGTAYTTWVAPQSATFNTSAFNEAFYLIHPQNKDFIITTSVSEAISLRNSGWRVLNGQRSLIQRSISQSVRPLYRFYNAALSDHLFTTNFSEGTNAGYAYEGRVGYVR